MSQTQTDTLFLHLSAAFAPVIAAGVTLDNEASMRLLAGAIASASLGFDGAIDNVAYFDTSGSLTGSNAFRFSGGNLFLTGSAIGLDSTSSLAPLNIRRTGDAIRLMSEEQTGIGPKIRFIESNPEFHLGVYVQYDATGNYLILGRHSVSDADTANDVPVVYIPRGTTNVGIGAAPNAGAILDVSGSTGAFIPPRLTTTQRDALTGVPGMIIYNSTTGTFQGFSGSVWGNLRGNS